MHSQIIPFLWYHMSYTSSGILNITGITRDQMDV